jgi:hypothetical protein
VAEAKAHTLQLDLVVLALKDLAVVLAHHMVVILIIIHRQVVAVEPVLKELKAMQVDHFLLHSPEEMVV